MQQLCSGLGGWAASKSDGEAARIRGRNTYCGPALQESWQIMNVNFFEWLRDGVRQSVLLGVSDAIEEIGSPAETDKLHPDVAAMLNGRKTKPKAARGGGRKRLGKSLKEMDTPTSA